MNVSLTPKLEQLVQQKVASGLYNSASEVVREALRLLNEHDRFRQRRLAEVRKEIAIGIKQLDRGEYAEDDERGLRGLVEDISRRGRQKLAQVRRKRRA